MEDHLRERAGAHGLRPVACGACAATGRGASDRPCPNCLGTGRLWRASGGLTLADAGLIRFLFVQDRVTSANRSSLH
jgi:hypothetical protein